MPSQITVPNGGTLSGAIAVPQYVIGLIIPALDTCNLYIQASVDGSNFYRLLKADGSGDWVISSTSGQRCIFLDQLAPFNWIRIECSQAQTADRVFKLALNPNLEGTVHNS